jgi:uncharacterized membrane protein
MKRKGLFLLLIVALVILAYLYTRPPEAVLSIGKVYNVTKVGQTVPVNVTLINVASCSAWLMTLSWDPYYVTLTPLVNASSGALPYEVIEGPFLKDVGTTRNLVFDMVNNANGEMVVGDQLIKSDLGASGTGVIMEMNFTVVHVGTTTLIMTPSGSSEIGSATGSAVAHVEASGLITNGPAPPFWEGAEFQTTLIAGDVLILLVATGILYLRAHPRPPKSQKRKAELQPIFEPKDESASS